MRYVTSVERIGMKRGMEKGMEKGAAQLLARMVARRFQVSDDTVMPLFGGMSVAQIEELGERIFEAETLDDIRRWAREMKDKE